MHVYGILGSDEQSLLPQHPSSSLLSVRAKAEALTAEFLIGQMRVLKPIE